MIVLVMRSNNYLDTCRLQRIRGSWRWTSSRSAPPYDVGPDITALFARRAVMEALTGIAMRRLGLTEPDHVHPRSAGTGTPRTYREPAAGPATADSKATGPSAKKM